MKGIVFEGGGAKGAYQIGAAKALREMGHIFDAIAGTSVGALNGAAVAQDEIPRAYDIWNDVEPDKVFHMAELNKAKRNHTDFVRMLKKIIEDRGLDTEPLNMIIRGFVDEDKIRKRNVIFGMVTVSIDDKKPVEIYLEDMPEGKLCDYIIASANFPLFKGARIDGKRFADGGLYNNFPINMLVNKGVDEIFAVRTFGIGVIRDYDIGEADLIKIEPAEKLGPILDFSSERIKKNLKLGYYDAYKKLKGYSGTKYYIDNDLDDDHFYHRLFFLDQQKLKVIAESMGIHDCDPRRFFFEIVVPKVAEYLGLEKNSGYKEIALAIFEMLAREEGIERFRIYKYSEFAKKVIDRSKENSSDEVLENIPAFLTRNDLLPKSIKNRIIKEIAVRMLTEK